MITCKNCEFYRAEMCLLDGSTREPTETCRQWVLDDHKKSSNAFSLVLDRMMQRVHKTACANGWHDTELQDATAIALIHSEASEALEAARHGNPTSEHIPEFSGIEEELADIMIRCMDYAAEKNLRLSRAILAKHEFNKTRSHKHGGKLF